MGRSRRALETGWRAWLEAIVTWSLRPPAPGTGRHQDHTPADAFGGGANKQRTCHGEDRQWTTQPGAGRTRGALAPRVSPWPAAQAEEGRRRNGWGEREAEPNGPANQVTHEKGPHRAPWA